MSKFIDELKGKMCHFIIDFGSEDDEGISLTATLYDYDETFYKLVIDYKESPMLVQREKVIALHPHFEKEELHIAIPKHLKEAEGEQ